MGASPPSRAASSSRAPRPCVYQTAWTREFAFAFGTSELAVATVLAAYMGGLAAGAALGGWLSPRVRRPVLAYGALELAVGLSALAVPFGMRAATGLYVALFGGGAETPRGRGPREALFYAACAFAVLAVPTICMGATLPLLARHAVPRRPRARRADRLALRDNAFGAVAARSSPASCSVPRLGLAPTVAVARRRERADLPARGGRSRAAPPPQPEAAAAGAVAPGAPALGARAVLPMMLALGRRLLHLRGALDAAARPAARRRASTPSRRCSRAFSSASRSAPRVAARLATDRRARRRAASEPPSSATAAALPRRPRRARRPRRPPPPVSARAGAPATRARRRPRDARRSCPRRSRSAPPSRSRCGLAARGAADAGPASARVYAWNTIGAIAGAIGAGFFALPAFGLTATLAGAALVNAALALLSPVARARRGSRRLPWLALPARRRRRRPLARDAVDGCSAPRPRASRSSRETCATSRRGAARRCSSSSARARGTSRTNGLPEAAIAPARRGAAAGRDPPLARAPPDARAARGARRARRRARRRRAARADSAERAPPRRGRARAGGDRGQPRRSASAARRPARRPAPARAS